MHWRILREEQPINAADVTLGSRSFRDKISHPIFACLDCKANELTSKLNLRIGHNSLQMLSPGNQSSSFPQNRKKPSLPACLECRAVKVKCQTTSTSETCDRCRWRSLNCVFEKHRRGRKPGTRIRKRTAQPNTQQQPSTSFDSDGYHESAETNNNSEVIQAQQPFTGPLPTCQLRGEISSPQSGVWGTEGLQQAGILSKEAQSGRFSLESILCVPDDDSHLASTNNPSAPVPTNLDDPIACGLITFPVAVGLFESFLRCLNPYICQLDPKLHTFGLVQQKSPFLLTAICTASAKAFHPALYPTLRAHTEKLLGKAFCDGSKSIETVQAILIFTYWKEPAENRTWMLVGYAIRMCIELGWHELDSSSWQSRVHQDELSVREARNIERTWLVLFVYDRSLSMQLGKPWMIENNDLIRKADSWHLERFAVAGQDLLLSAFVCLRMTSSVIFELAASSQTPNDTAKAEVFSNLLNSSVDTWEQDWLPLFETGAEPCQRFLVHFYSLHLRLMLNSYSLQRSLNEVKTGVPIPKSALWLCSSSAIGMLNQISQVFGPHKQLYFVQDSMHIMTAYAAIFLIKILVSLPTNLQSDLESNSIQAILRASNTFEKQCITDSTGCAMQTRFLRNVVEKYHKLKLQRQSSGHTGHLEERTEPQLLLSGPQFQSIMNTTQLSNSTSPAHTVIDNSELTQDNEQRADFGADMFAHRGDTWEHLFSDPEFWTGEGIFMSENFNRI